MKRVLLFFVIVVAFGLFIFINKRAICPKPDYSSDPELAEAWQKYQAIDFKHLTSEQMEMIKEFDRVYPILSEEGLNFIKSYPWIDVEKPSQRDKIFIMQVAYEMMNNLFI